MERDGIGFEPQGRKNFNVSLRPIIKFMSAWLLRAHEKGYVPHGNGDTDQEGMLVRGLGGR